MTDELALHFAHIDTGGDGSIDPTEFIALVRRLGMTRTAGLLRHMFDEIDQNGDGRISRDEFAAWWARIQHDD
ncbi:MAG: EF-hand domain-containing protein [Pseudomonadota bacterium]